MKDNLEKTYRDLLKKNKIEPPEQVWDNLSQNLDIDKVWANISQDLDLQPFRWFENLSIAVSTATFLLSIILVSFPPTGSIPPQNQVSEAIVDVENIQDEVKDISGNEEASDPGKLKYIQDELIDQKITGESVSSGSPVPGTAGIIDQDSRRDIDLAIPTDPLVPIQSVSLVDPEVNLRKPSYLVLSNQLSAGNIDWNLKEMATEEKSGNTPLEVYFGISGSIRNTWIINSKTISGFRSQELHTTRPVFGPEFGIFLGTRFNRRTSATGEFYFSSNYAQSYDEYIEGHYTTTSFNVDYSKINLLLSYKIKSKANLNRSTDILLGPAFGILKSANESVNQNKTDLTENYKSHVVGITGGVQRVYQISQDFDLLLGLRFNYGLNNIYKGTTVIPASFRITHPAAIKFSMGINYNL